MPTSVSSSSGSVAVSPAPPGGSGAGDRVAGSNVPLPSQAEGEARHAHENVAVPVARSESHEDSAMSTLEISMLEKAPSLLESVERVVRGRDCELGIAISEQEAFGIASLLCRGQVCLRGFAQRQSDGTEVGI